MRTMRIVRTVTTIMASSSILEMIQPVGSFVVNTWSQLGQRYNQEHFNMGLLSATTDSRNSKDEKKDNNNNEGDNDDDDDDESNGALPTWLIYHLYTWDLQVANFADTGRGLRTMRTRKAGDTIIAVPQEHAITLQSLQMKYADIFQPLAASSLKEESAMALGLLLLRRDKNPYVTSLPTEQCLVFSRHMPLDLLDCLPAAYRRLVSCYRLYVEEMHQDMLQTLKQAGTPEKFVALVESLDDFEWAFSTVRSRTVGVPAEDIPGNTHPNSNETVRVLLPGFDLLNHRFGAQVSHDLSDGSFVVASQDEYETGDQVFISYVSSKIRRDNLNMLLTYGFCPSHNPEQVLFVDTQNLLVACAQARPDYFTGPVLMQLHGLFTKFNKTRDLYAYDGATKEPRNCMDTAIRMMLEIEQQFVRVPDPEFSRDVRKKLLEKRGEEIADGMKQAAVWDDKVRRQQPQQHARWNPMRQSIQTLLSLEQGYLAEKSFRSR